MWDPGDITMSVFISSFGRYFELDHACPALASLSSAWLFCSSLFPLSIPSISLRLLSNFSVIPACGLYATLPAKLYEPAGDCFAV